ncbi:lipoarabinomannan carrier protein LprG [Flexivirga endophytica]|uniref:Lipoarabinomannan carrier protein LprG n=1 Tax=Flexivirga endophytica TaxID=1849103 RepID=A0A916WST0_9MICO|nr:LppX_LprAFG lipoprotein [Flexivirga endophytica]GGB29424.1 lipoarabinomannan carrier protein LprG [Flexivirga endophytica]GHB50508.1 lipoarabinomannan carrier protein LprG [Flexivirga endophytica]
MRRTLTVSSSLAIAAALALTGCSSGSKDAPATGASGGSQGAVTPKAMLAKAKKTLDDTSGVHLKLTSDKIPPKENGLISGEGDGSHAPAFKGKIAVRIPAAGTISVPVVAVGGKVWAKTPLNPKMAEIDPKQFGAPDPAQIFARDGGFSTLLVATKSPKFGDKKRDGKDIVQTVTGTLPGKTIKQTLNFGNANETYDAVYQITDKGELRSAELTGAFYKGSNDTSYTVEFTKYGQKVAVTKP